MATNTNRTRDSHVIIPVTVAEGTESGDVIAIGAAGLTGYAVTDRYVEADYDENSITAPPQGLADGEASVEIVGVSRVVTLTVAGGVALGAKIYATSAGVYNATATANTLIGFALEAITDGETGLVGLARA